MDSFNVKVGPVSRNFPTMQLNNVDRVPIIEFIGDSEFTNEVAQAMLPLIPEGTDILLTVVTNALPLTHEMSDRSGIPYVCVRKKRRTYMTDPLIVNVPSMTLGVTETLWLDRRQAERLRGKKVTIVQDVIASGGTARALARFVDLMDGTVNGYITAFSQGSTDLPVKALQELPKIS